MKIRGSTLTTPISRKAIVKDSVVSGTPWSSQATVDRLCPVFVESGTMVACEPVEGYPLAVTAPEASTITRCGKNLFAKKGGPTAQTYATTGGGQLSRWGYRIELPAGTYTLHAELVGTEGAFMFVYVNGADGSHKDIKDINKTIDLLKNNVTVTLDAGDVIFIVRGSESGGESGSKKLFAAYNIQIEVGNTATAYEPYQGEIFAPEVAIPALPGVNTLWADSGAITVTGRANPAAIIEKLTNAIIALGGNI